MGGITVVSTPTATLNKHRKVPSEATIILNEIMIN